MRRRQQSMEHIGRGCGGLAAEAGGDADIADGELLPGDALALEADTSEAARMQPNMESLPNPVRTTMNCTRKGRKCA